MYLFDVDKMARFLKIFFILCISSYSSWKMVLMHKFDFLH